MSTMYRGRPSGQLFKNNYYKNTNINVSLLRQEVEAIVNETLRRNNIYTENGTNLNGNQQSNAERSEQNKKRKWKISTLGATMAGLQTISAGTRYINLVASTDDAKKSKELLSTGLNMATLALGAFGGVWGLVGATVLSFLRGMAGQYLENQIQELYDSRRLQYKLSNYDLSKYSTQTYDYNKQKWIATDTQRIERNILKNTKIS